MEKEQIDRFTLRLPSELLIELKVMAARSRRSLNAQVVSLLEKSINDALSTNEKSEATAS